MASTTTAGDKQSAPLGCNTKRTTSSCIIGRSSGSIAFRWVCWVVLVCLFVPRECRCWTLKTTTTTTTVLSSSRNNNKKHPHVTATRDFSNSRLLLSSSSSSSDESNYNNNHEGGEYETSSSVGSRQRRKVMVQLLLGSAAATLSVSPQAASAGEIGARINEAVTQSDLGLSVRRSVVKGAQVMDAVDGSWERLSDRFQLGTARSQREGRPPPKTIPPPQPLDSQLARQFVETMDQTFLETCSSSGGTSSGTLSLAELQQRIQKVVETVKPSFERAGVTKEEMDSSSRSSTASQGIASHALFNFVSYCHFKAYSDVLIEEKTDFQTFKRNFERIAGQRIFTLLLPNEKNLSAASKQLTTKNEKERRLLQLNAAVDTINVLCQELVRKGFVARIDPPALDTDQLNEWSEDLSELTWSLGLDGDITQNAQILLQEQGLRFYPNYSQSAIQYVLNTMITGQDISVEDYYMDTDYNSDLDKFEVKEVLLNIVMDSSAE